MPPLSAEQLAQLSPLGVLLLEAHSTGRLPSTALVEFAGRLVIRIPAMSPDVGDLEIVDDQSEYTVVVGHHTHHHVMTWEQDPRDSAAEHQAAIEDLITRIAHIVTDRTVIWRSPRGAGGTFSIELGPEQLEAGATAWLWSGRRYPGPSGAAGGSSSHAG